MMINKKMPSAFAQALLEPIIINNLTLPNRVIMAPMSRYKSAQGIPTSDTAQYYRRRAEGGVGLIITEGTVIGHKASYDHSDVPHMYGEAALAGWRNVVTEVHAAGGKIFSQLWHVGGVRQTGIPPDINVPGYAPSAIIHPGAKLQEVPYEMKTQDIRETIQAFADAALNAKRLGFDGVEIHGAHGFLIDQFFWSYTNKRSDHYGGNVLKDRMRFATEVLQAIRQVVGIDYPLSFRLSQWKLGAYDTRLVETPKELEQLLYPLLLAAGVDIFHCSTRQFHQAEFSGSKLNLAGWVKKITGKPVVTVGGVGLDSDFVSNIMSDQQSHFDLKNIKILLQRLEKQEFDFVAVGRALLADPYWLKKIIEQRFDEIKIFTKECLQNFY